MKNYIKIAVIVAVIAIITAISILFFKSETAYTELDIKYPFRVEVMSPESKFGGFEASILNRDTFIIGENKYFIDSSNDKIYQIELPKVTENTKENYGDNIINEANLATWRSYGDVNYEKYVGSLEATSEYVPYIRQIEDITFLLPGKADISAGSHEVIVDRNNPDNREYILNIDKLLGLTAEKHIDDQNSNNYGVYYIIDENGELSYISYDTKAYGIRRGVAFYRDIDENGGMKGEISVEQSKSNRSN